MTLINHTLGYQSLDAALTEYYAATLTAADQLKHLLSVDVSRNGSVARTLPELRRQAATRLRSATGEAAVISAPDHDPASDIFSSVEGADSRFIIRSAIRLTHDLGFAPHDELAVGELAVAAIRSAGSNLSQLAYRLAESDHVEYIHALNTLGHSVRVQRDFVVRTAVLGLGEALNSESEPDLPSSVAVEAWLGKARSRQQQR